jgi:DNA-binding winged helix-turn-helix (wHTH) protein
MQALKSDEALQVISSSPARYVRFGSFDLDLQRQELFRAGARIPMSRKVLEVLMILLEKPGDVVTRETLRNRLWPPDFHVNYNANVNTTVNKLRLILGDSTDQPTFVATIPRRGYAFIAKTDFFNQPSVREDTSPLAASAPTASKMLGKGTLAGKILALLLTGMLFGAVVAYLALHH